MKNDEDAESRSTEPEQEQPEEAAGLRLPGFINDEDVGLGDILKGLTSVVGIRPCGGCERRAAALNRRIIFSGRRPK
jgi:hypothetical protein